MHGISYRRICGERGERERGGGERDPCTELVGSDVIVKKNLDLRI